MNIIAKKSLGQNFLNDQATLKKIIEAGELSEKDVVLEIGPGQGALTKELLKKAGKVIAVEKDDRLFDFLSGEFAREIKAGQLILINDDVMKLNVKRILEENGAENYKIIANIPYYITGQILKFFLESDFQPEQLVLMVQKEVAQRICQEPGKMSILSVSVQFYAEAEIVCLVPKEFFQPVPEVDSAVIKIKMKQLQRDTEFEKIFFQTVKIGFSSPRKTLWNNLQNGFHLEKDQLEKLFSEMGIDKNARAQELGIERWKELTVKLKNR